MVERKIRNTALSLWALPSRGILLGLLMVVTSLGSKSSFHFWVHNNNFFSESSALTVCSSTVPRIFNVNALAISIYFDECSLNNQSFTNYNNLVLWFPVRYWHLMRENEEVLWTMGLPFRGCTFLEEQFQLK